MRGGVPPSPCFAEILFAFARSCRAEDPVPTTTLPLPHAPLTPMLPEEGEEGAQTRSKSKSFTGSQPGEAQSGANPCGEGASLPATCLSARRRRSGRFSGRGRSRPPGPTQCEPNAIEAQLTFHRQLRLGWAGHARGEGDGGRSPLQLPSRGLVPGRSKKMHRLLDGNAADPESRPGRASRTSAAAFQHSGGGHAAALPPLQPIARFLRWTALRSKNSAWLTSAETVDCWYGLETRNAGSGRSPVRKRSG
jgi:hypothetical protein